MRLSQGFNIKTKEPKLRLNSAIDHFMRLRVSQLNDHFMLFYLKNSIYSIFDLLRLKHLLFKLFLEKLMFNFRIIVKYQKQTW